MDFELKFHRALQAVVESGYIQGALRSYSGRGMYGRECLALVCPRTLQESVLGALLMQECHDPSSAFYEENELLLMFLEATRTDDLGLDKVLYWPKVPFIKE